jgi:phage terminase small subunit
MSTKKPGNAAARRALFVEAYFSNEEVGTKAAIAAGYSAKTAAQAASRLLKDVNVAVAIAVRRKEILDEARKKSQLTVDELLESLARDLRFDPANLYDAKGNAKPIHEIDASTRLSLRGLEVTKMLDAKGKVTGYTVKARYPEKTSVREQGMRHMGLFEKDNKQKPRGQDLRVRFVPSPNTAKPGVVRKS